MEAHLLEWLNLSVRWVHMITGVAWIGASFYFVWLENNLNRVNPKTGLAGDLWAIHGGGIYHLEKYKLAPPAMPENLHWFKWEAYFTWMSGIALLCVVFYSNPTLYLLAPGSTLSGPEGVAIGIGSLFLGWFIYSFLCDSALGKRPALLGGILFVLIIGGQNADDYSLGYLTQTAVGVVVGLVVNLVIAPAPLTVAAAGRRAHRDEHRVGLGHDIGGGAGDPAGEQGGELLLVAVLELEDQAARGLVIDAGGASARKGVGLDLTGQAAVGGEVAAVVFKGRAAAVADGGFQKDHPAPGVGRQARRGRGLAAVVGHGRQQNIQQTAPRIARAGCYRRRHAF